MLELKSSTDGQLLTAFAEGQDEDAFAELVRRHGPLVLRLCRRVLRNSADAEDAAQAAFLALARQAPRQHTLRSTAAWLHRVARNIALDMLASRKARERREEEVAAMTPDAVKPAGMSNEQGTLLHEEIDALPEKYRQAVILCHLEEKSMEQAAAIMACPASSVGTWVARAREQLRSRLARRGVVLSLAALTSLLSAEAGAAELPATFATSTTAAAARFVAGNSGGSAGAGALSSSTASLAEGALKKMYYAKLQAVTVMVVLLLCVGAGTGWVVNRASGAEGSVAKQPSVPAAAPAAVQSPVAIVKPAAKVAQKDLQALVDGNNAFALKMYAQLAAKEGNVFCSPYSISSALGMTYAGARGNTATEMEKALCFTLGQEHLHTAFKTSNTELAGRLKESGQKLNIANGLCLTGGDVSNEFKALLQKYYGAEIFGGDLDKINGWVKTKTEGKIEKILEKLSANSVCVLLNAIYFKGLWERPFKKDYTREQPFKVSASKQVKAPLMYQKSQFKMLDKKDFQIAVLPYKGRKLSMVVVLPRETAGLPALEKKLNSKNLSLWLAEVDKSREQEMYLFLPRFKVETGYDLVPTFKELGMKDAFGKGAFPPDFRGMGWPKGKLWIAQIKHKAFCEVNEEGTEAAAATAVEMEKNIVRVYPRFRADHPFLYLIRDNTTGSILFMGRLVDPKP